MKKIISLSLVLAIMAASLVFAIPSGAAEYDGFTVYCSPSASTLQEGSEDIASVTLNFANNPGLWATRVFVVYPDGLSLDNGSGVADVTNGSVYSSSSEMFLGIPDLAINDSRQVDAMEKIAKENDIPTEGYRSTCIYFEPSVLETITTSDGVLATLNFRLTDSAESGDVLDIRLYYGENDFLWASIDSGNNVNFVSYYPAVPGADITVSDCPHPSVYEEHKDADCENGGYDREICAQCKDILSETVIPAKGHEPSDESVTVAPTCTAEGSRTTYCAVCGEVVSEEVLSVTDHSYKDTVVEPTRTEQGYTVHTCTVCGYEFTDSYVDALGGDPVAGDLSGDEKVNAVDLNVLRRVISGNLTPTDDQTKAGDINGDGLINGVDANLVSCIVAGQV